MPCDFWDESTSLHIHNNLTKLHLVRWRSRWNQKKITSGHTWWEQSRERQETEIYWPFHYLKPNHKPNQTKEWKIRNKRLVSNHELGSFDFCRDPSGVCHLELNHSLKPEVRQSFSLSWYWTQFMVSTCKVKKSFSTVTVQSAERYLFKDKWAAAA